MHFTEDTVEGECSDAEPDPHESDDDLVDKQTACDHHAAHVAYQAAKDKYRAAPRGRGTDQGELQRCNEERLRLAKQRSFCSACKCRHHWHKDPECPLRGKNPEAANAKRPSPSTVLGGDAAANDLHHYAGFPHFDQGDMASQVWMTVGGRGDAAEGQEDKRDLAMKAIVDTACTRAVAGYTCFEDYCAVMDRMGLEVKTCEAVDYFKFGASRVHRSDFSVDAWFATRGKWYMVNVAVVPCRVPLLFSRPVLSKLGAYYDMGNHEMGRSWACADWT